METRLLIATFILLGLSAAGLSLAAPTSSEAGLAPTNVTVILKNRDFPLMDPCALAPCIEI